MVRLLAGDWLGIADIDDALFPLGGILNYYANADQEPRSGSTRRSRFVPAPEVSGQLPRGLSLPFREFAR